MTKTERSAVLAMIEAALIPFRAEQAALRQQLTAALAEQHAIMSGLVEKEKLAKAAIDGVAEQLRKLDKGH